MLADGTEGSVTLGQGIVELDRLERVGLRLRQDVRGAGAAVVHEQAVAIRQTGVRQRKVGVEGNGPFEESLRLSQRLFGTLVPQVAALQIQVVGLGARGGRLHQRTIRHELRSQRLYDCGRQLVLHREDVLELAVVGLRPHVIAVRDADELREYTQAIAVPAHAPLQHRGDVQLLADLADVEVLPLEGECGGAGDHANSLHVREAIDDLLRHAVGEVLVLFVVAVVHEG